jgi:hypothetical protein
MLLDLNEEDLKVLYGALNEIPYCFANPLINKINAQIQAANDAQVDAHDMPSGQTKPKDKFAGD